MSIAKRDLGKLGVSVWEHLERPLAKGIIVAVKVALRANEDGTECNRVKRLDVVASEPSEPEPSRPSGNGASSLRRNAKAIACPLETATVPASTG